MMETSPASEEAATEPSCQNMAAQCLGHPNNRVAIVDLTGGRRYVTYGDLAEMTDGIARMLMERVRPGDRVGVLFSQTPWCAAAHLAIWKIGSISVPLFKLFKRDALASRVQDSGVRFVLTDAGGAQLLGDLAEPLLAHEIGTIRERHSTNACGVDLYIGHNGCAQRGVAWPRHTGGPFAGRFA